jgi:hypothetical protein
MLEEFTKYREKLTKDQRKILDNFHNKNNEVCKKAIKNAITTDQRHSIILNMCAYAFSEGGPLRQTGYHYITVDPLYKYRGEEGSKIFDLVLYNKEYKRAILIECKSSIGDPRRSVLNPLKDQIDNVKNHKTDLEDEIGGEIGDMEYVICGSPQDIEEVGKAIKDNETVCLWSADLYFFTLKLYNPVGSSGKQNAELIKKKQLHADPELREKLYMKTESRGQIDGVKITSSSHIFRILSRVFIRVIQQILSGASEKEKRFWLHELVDMLKEELPKLNHDDVKSISETLYKLAEKIGILEIESNVTHQAPNPDPSFRLKIGTRSSRTFERFIEEKYIETVCEEKSAGSAIKEYMEYLASTPGSLDYHFSKSKEPTNESNA